ncbi:MAG: PDZ domain-containing protein [Acidobacteria bacterium]|nr:PDZ domain-containing protein [Acidobacteriota bacterium]
MRRSLRYLATIIAIGLAVGVWFPSSYAQDRVLRIFSNDDSSGAFLGIRMTDVTEENMSEYDLDSVQGVIVESVVDGSPAEAADLQEKDVILEFDGLKVRSKIQFSRLVKETPVGRDVEVLISRDGKRKNIKVRLEEQNEQRAESRSFVLPEPFGERDNRGFYYRFPEDLPMPERWMDRTAPTLGITVQAIPDQLGEFFEVPEKRGVLVTSVRQNSPSAGKLKAGDVIIRVEGREVSDPAVLQSILQRTEGEKIGLDVIRDKKEIRVVVSFPGDNGKEAGDGKEYKL